MSAHLPPPPPPASQPRLVQSARSRDSIRDALDDLHRFHDSVSSFLARPPRGGPAVR